MEEFLHMSGHEDQAVKEVWEGWTQPNKDVKLAHGNTCDRDDANLQGWCEQGTLHLDHSCELICKPEAGWPETKQHTTYLANTTQAPNQIQSWITGQVEWVDELSYRVVTYCLHPPYN